MKIIFMGTPDFALPTLLALFQSSHEITLVVTGIDKPRGRGQRVIPTPVKVQAMDFDLPVYQPESLKSPEVSTHLKKYAADLYVVVAFRILPQAVIEIPGRGVINLHASLLPLYRGAAPIQWALLNGETRTGVTTFFIEKGVDTGDIILQKGIDIDPEDNAGTLHDKLAVIGAEIVLETVELIDGGAAPRRRQTGDATRAPKITREMCQIDWKNSVETIMNQIRAFSPHPGAFAYLGDKLVKIYRARQNPAKSSAKFGSLQIQEGNRLLGRCGDGWLEILEIQQEGKKKLNTDEFIRGIDRDMLLAGFH
jgi:methionyl-tRNA formyltransferase